MEMRIPTDLEENINRWHKCPGCQELVFDYELERDLYTCRHCGNLFPLLAINRLEHLLDDESEIESRVDEESGIIAEGRISGRPTCLFISDINVRPDTIDVSFFVSAIESALQEQIPLIAVIACQPIASRPTLAETSYVTMQMDRLAEASIPHITVLTETKVPLLTTYLPVGELVLVEGDVSDQKSEETSPNFQPALHAPEEQLLTQPASSEKEIRPDLSVDCYISREDLPKTLGLFLSFFSK